MISLHQAKDCAETLKNWLDGPDWVMDEDEIEAAHDLIEFIERLANDASL